MDLNIRNISFGMSVTYISIQLYNFPKILVVLK
jgi:hypothetical protein